jgi:aspartate 1-decarboxylase
MLREMCKSKIHQAVVTEANLYYSGSITIDGNLMKEANIYPNEKVQIANLNTGERLETYTIAGEKDSGEICLNGAAARCAQVGDTILIISYCILEDKEAKKFHPRIVHVDQKNKIVKIVDNTVVSTDDAAK